MIREGDEDEQNLFPEKSNRTAKERCQGIEAGKVPPFFFCWTIFGPICVGRGKMVTEVEVKLF